MEYIKSPIIVVDPGHGGYELGALAEGRREKDDNLRLGLALREALRERGVRVLMTRESDRFVPLTERVGTANEAGADLFVSLHRNACAERLPSPGGVEGVIYLTTPEATTKHAARLVLDRMAAMGIADGEITRGNHYLLRRTRMPALLLQAGRIGNEPDDRIFDERLHSFAVAIADGILTYFRRGQAPAG